MTELTVLRPRQSSAGGQEAVDPSHSLTRTIGTPSKISPVE
jgi:hypothetical protein